MKIALLIEAKIDKVHNLTAYLPKGKWRLVGGKEYFSKFSPTINTEHESKKGFFLDIHIDHDSKDDRVSLFLEEIKC